MRHLKHSVFVTSSIAVLVCSISSLGVAQEAAPVDPSAAEAPSAPGDASDADDGRADNVMYLELLGNAGLYSLNYERRFGDKVYGRLGLSYFSVGASAGESSAKVTLMTFPLMANYLVGDGSSHLELGAGALLLYAGGEVDSGGSRSSGEGVGIAGTATVGYRYQPPDGGFVFKVGFTPLVGVGGFLPWGGVSFGGAF